MQKKRLIGVAVTLGLIVGLSATKETLAQSAPTEELRIAIASPAMVYGPVWIAMAEKMFDKHGVNVSVVSTNAFSTGSAMLVSGSTDVVVNTVYPGLRIALEGKDLSYLMNLSNMGAAINAIIAKPGIGSLEDLAAMGSNCKFVSLPAGSGSWAILQGIVAKYDLKCSLSTAGTMPNVVAGALSGQFDAAMVNPLDAYAGEQAGKVKIIVDPLKITPEQSKDLYPYNHTFSTVFGIRTNLEDKKEAVVRFLRALREANAYIAGHSPQELGELVSEKLPDVFGSTPKSALVLQWQIQSSLFPKGDDAGMIAADDWKNVVAAAPAWWGFANLDPDNPTIRYEKVVDMSFFEAAK